MAKVKPRAKWPDDCPDPDSEIITRALQVIGLDESPHQSTSFRKYIAKSIFFIKVGGSGRETSAGGKRKKELRLLVDVLRKTIELLEYEGCLALFFGIYPKGLEIPFPVHIQLKYACSDEHSFD